METQHLNIMFALYSFTLLWMMSVSRSTPMVYENLVYPLDQQDPRHFDGKWALVAGSLSHLPSMEALRLRDSITVYFSNPSNTSRVAYTQVNRFGDQCQYLHYNISVQNSSFTFDVRNRFELTGSFLPTSCPDCLVMQWNVNSSRRLSTDLYLLSKRREVEQKELEEFKTQMKGYELPEPVVLDPTKELCPEQPESQPTAAAAQTEEKTVEPKA